MVKLFNILFWGIIAIFVSFAGESWSQEINGKTFSVKDAVEFAHFINLDYDRDLSAYGSVAPIRYSPDRMKAAVVVRRNNVENGMREFELWILERENKTASTFAPVFRRANILELISGTNDPAIARLRWVDDSTLGFLGMATPFEKPQVMNVNLMGYTRVMTNADERIISFDITNADTVIYSVETETTDNYADTDGPGFVIGDHVLDDILGIADLKWRRNTEYRVSNNSIEDFRIVQKAELYQATIPAFVSLSPSGKYAVVTTGPKKVPENWSTFLLTTQANPGSDAGVFHVELSLVDLETLEVSPITGGPMAFPMNEIQVLWNEKADQLLVFDQFISNDKAMNLGISKQSAPVSVEFDLKTKKLRRLISISPPPVRPHNAEVEISALSFNEQTNSLQIYRGEGSAEGYVRGNLGWVSLKGTVEPEGSSGLYAEVISGISTPPILRVCTSKGENCEKLLDPNPEVSNRLNPTELLSWNDRNDRTWQAGLVLPANIYEPNNLPLVILSRGFSADYITVSGYGGSASAQALASEGFAVAIIGEGTKDPAGQDSEFDVQTEGYRSLIEHLHDRELVNPDRVGISVFSRSGFWLQHALSVYPDMFQAVIAADASSFESSAFFRYYNWLPQFQRSLTSGAGASPYGAGWKTWIENNPLAKSRVYEIPVRLEDYDKKWPSWWEVYVAMRMENEPVEYYFLNEAPHNPLMPNHLYWLQNVGVDWFNYWLKDETNSSPLDPNQYQRWDTLKGQACSKVDRSARYYCNRVSARD